MFPHFQFRLDILSTIMTRILIPYDFSCEIEVSDNVHTNKLPDSANKNSQNDADSPLICCQALGRLPWISLSEEQCWHPTLTSSTPD